MSANDASPSRAKRLLIICGDFLPTQSPEAAHAYHLAVQFAQRGHEVTVLTTATGEGFEHPGVTVARHMPSWGFGRTMRLARFLRRARPDAILLLHLDSIYDHQPMITFAPSIAGKVLPGVPFVTQFENILPHDKAPLVTKVIRTVARRYLTGARTDYHYGTLLRDSRRVIVLAERHLALLRERDPTVEERSVLIPPAPIMQMSPAGSEEARRRTREAVGLSPGDLVFCYYGYLYPGKGVETMLRAFAQTSAQYPQVKLMVIGGSIQYSFDPEFAARSRAYETMARGLADSLGITDQVRWLGHCPPTEPEGGRYLRAADACVMPFDRGVCLNNSSFGAVAAHGLPILTTFGSDTDAAITRTGHVFGVPGEDVTSMAAAMNRFAAEPDLRRDLAAGADAMTRKWFDWDIVIERIRATFDAT